MRLVTINEWSSLVPGSPSFTTLHVHHSLVPRPLPKRWEWPGDKASALQKTKFKKLGGLG